MPPPIKQPRGLLIQGWHYIKVVSSHFGMEYIWNIQIQISETTAAWWKKSIISLWLRPINIQYYRVSPWFILWVYGGNIFGEATREATRVKHGETTLTKHPILSCSPKKDKPWNAIKISICRLHPVFLPLDMHLFENAEITPRLIAISMGNMSFSNPVESYLGFSNMFRYIQVQYQTFMALFENRLPPKFDVDHLLIICWSPLRF